MPVLQRANADDLLNGSDAKVDPSGLKAVIHSTLQQCNLVAQRLPLDTTFVQKCLDNATGLGVPLHSNSPSEPSFHRANLGGSAIAYFAFAHLKSEETKIFIATYTSLIIYIEDVYGERWDVVGGFVERFVRGEEQGTAVLEAFARHLKRTPEYFGEMQTNSIMIGTFKWVSSLWHEYGGGGGGPQTGCAIRECGGSHGLYDLLDCDCGFPTYMRGMSGNGEPYVMFMFPKEVDFKDYAQAIPSLTEAINYFNDILSLYKEDLANEETNYLSIMALHLNTTKLAVLRQLGDRVVHWHLTTRKLLEGKVEGGAFDAFMRFSQGYVDYHVSAERYKLGELMDAE